MNQAEDENKLKLIEEDIADILMEEGKNKAHRFNKFSAENGSVSVGEMWSLKKRLWPKKKETIQMGNLNHQGVLVTSPEDIKSLLYK